MNGRNPPSIGALRERVELKTKVQSMDGAGGHTDSFTPLATVWAHVQSHSGTLSTFADGRSVKISHTFKMRFRSDLKSGDRITFRMRDLEIVSADDLDGRRAYLSCRCAQVNQTG